MRIAVCGLTGSGKSTLGEELSRSLNIPHISYTFKDLAKEKGISLMEFQKLASNDDSIDKEFDEQLRKQSKEKGSFVVATWLAPWILDLDVRIWVHCSDEIRAERTSKRDKVSKAEAMKHLKERDKNNHERYKKIYGIDTSDLSSFDLKLDTGKISPEKLVDKIISKFKLK